MVEPSQRRVVLLPVLLVESAFINFWAHFLYFSGTDSSSTTGVAPSSFVLVTLSSTCIGACVGSVVAAAIAMRCCVCVCMCDHDFEESLSYVDCSSRSILFLYFLANSTVRVVVL